MRKPALPQINICSKRRRFEIKNLSCGKYTREFILFVSSIALCSIFLLPLIFRTSPYGIWADLFAKDTKGQEKESIQSSILKNFPGKSRRGSTVDQVLIKASSIYWGDVSDLTKPEVFYSHKIRLTSSKQPKIVTGEEALKDIKNEIRQALRKFEKRYNVKIVWDERCKSCPDVTAAFIDFFDKGYHQTVEGRLPGNGSPLPTLFREEQ